MADQRQQNSQRQKEGEVAERVPQAVRSQMWMRVPILKEAFERIAKRNEVYVIRMRTAKPGDVSGNDRDGGNNADVDHERRDEKLSFDNACQVSDVRRV